MLILYVWVKTSTSSRTTKGLIGGKIVNLLRGCRAGRRRGIGGDGGVGGIAAPSKIKYCSWPVSPVKASSEFISISTRRNNNT